MDTLGTTTASIELDARHRAPLGRLARHDRYAVTVEPSGRIILEPAVLLTQSQLKLLQNGEFWEELDAIVSEGSADYVDFEELPAP